MFPAIGLYFLLLEIFLCHNVHLIFFDEYHVGGFEELRALEKENKLLNLLK